MKHVARHQKMLSTAFFKFFAASTGTGIVSANFRRGTYVGLLVLVMVMVATWAVDVGRMMIVIVVLFWGSVLGRCCRHGA